MPDSDPTLSVAQVARRLGVHRDTVISLIERGDLPALKIPAGQKWRYRISESDFALFLIRHQAIPRKPTPVMPTGKRAMRRRYNLARKQAIADGCFRHSNPPEPLPK